MQNDHRSTSRRDLLKATGVGIGALAAGVPSVHAAGSETIRVGLIGCGGRGTGAAEQALATGDDVKLVAMGDVFADHLDSSAERLKKLPGFAVDADHRFVGFDAYEKVIDAVDVVLLATPPHFRPAHLEAAIGAGKHVFTEKPMAVDGPGVRRVLEVARLADEKGVCLGSGFVFRYNPPTREMMRRVWDGAIGEIVALQVSYNVGALWSKPRQPEWSDTEWQLRNWLYFTWLSGDHIVEQHVHSLDMAAMFLQNEYPVAAVGTGGRQARTSPDFGNIFDHHAVVFEYAGGRRCYSSCRQQEGTFRDVSDIAFGTKGTATKKFFDPHEITGENPWRPNRRGRQKARSGYQIEHNELFDAIRTGGRHNDGEWMAKSTLMAIMGRMATYTGQRITFEQALGSDESLGPDQYVFGSMPVEPVAIPGKTASPGGTAALGR